MPPHPGDLAGGERGEVIAGIAWKVMREPRPEFAAVAARAPRAVAAERKDALIAADERDYSSNGASRMAAAKAP